MFILHSSNKTENLLAHLVAILQHAPLASPFSEEVFLIQSQGMERWLSQQLAAEFKVWGNYRFLFPGKFFSSLAQKLDSRLSDEAFDRHLMLWRFEAALRHLQGDVFKPLLHYLSGENVELKRFQLAQQLSQIFDQYQMMRPDMLALWQQEQLLYGGETEAWQCALWRQVSADIGPKHRGALWLQLIDKFNAAEPGQFQTQLPERVSVFGVHSLPPLFLSYLQGLSRHCDVHFYLLNPAQVYWGDAPGKKLRAQLEQFDGHPLLATLGQQGREFQQMLLDQLQFELELDSFEAASAVSNLQQLQNDILGNERPACALENDGSIAIHACHSRMREVQVMKNQLLAALEQDPELELRDIVVMAPDIQLYAPFISAVFDDIQHAIADRSLSLSNTALDVYLRFLHLSRSRFGWQEVLDLLEQPAVYLSFGLSEADLDLIRYWVDDTRVRWGRNAEHKQQLGLPPLAENTWQAALERLLMGYAVADDGDFVDGVLPYKHIEGSAAQALGGLHDFCRPCFRPPPNCKAAKTCGNGVRCCIVMPINCWRRPSRWSGSN
nr:exodeoxyribonuclease V subunit gamma [Methylomarinum sp. Ch1-1]MDP4522499.1 exodeoxyribonuclease V subunit gamma [Methylomarinum sp. Ch1-1]